MTHYSFEGTTDYIAATPALIVTLEASGSITAGRAVAFDAGNTSEVYTPSAVAVADGTQCAGLSIEAAADSEVCGVLVWGFAKNVPAVAGYTPQPGDRIQISGSAKFTSIATGSFLSNPYVVAGKVLSGSGAGNNFLAFIDCMK